MIATDSGVRRLRLIAISRASSASQPRRLTRPVSGSREAVSDSERSRSVWSMVVEASEASERTTSSRRSSVPRIPSRQPVQRTAATTPLRITGAQNQELISENRTAMLGSIPPACEVSGTNTGLPLPKVRWTSDCSSSGTTMPVRSGSFEAVTTRLPTLSGSTRATTSQPARPGAARARVSRESGAASIVACSARSFGPRPTRSRSSSERRWTGSEIAGISTAQTTARRASSSMWSAAGGISATQVPAITNVSVRRSSWRATRRTLKVRITS